MKKAFWLLIFFSQSLWALVPIEGALLGKVNEDFQKDPLDLVFASKLSKDKNQNQLELKLFNGFILEGERLANSCSSRDKLIYRESWQERTAVASVVSSLQYVGLDVTTRAIGKYARVLDFSEEEYGHLVERLIGNYCSKNITVISLKNLKENLLKRYESDNDFSLPAVSQNSFFPTEINKTSESLKARENELINTVKLFRNFCSWDGDHQDYRLMVPVLRNPFIMAFMNRLIEGTTLDYNSEKKVFTYAKTEGTVKVLCRDLICRPAPDNEFRREFPRAIGSPEIKIDLNRIYCSKFRDIDYVIKEQEDHIKKWINQQSLEDEKFLQMQMIALLTKIPDFMMGVSSYKDFIQVAKYGVDETWTNWAMNSNQEFTHDLYFEESLKISVADRKFYYFFLEPKFKVQIDLSVGEFDKTTVINDKIGFVYDLKMNKSYARWIRSEYQNAVTKEASDKAIEQMVSHLTPKLSHMSHQLKIAPWNEGLTRLVAIELLEQFRLYQGNYFAELSSTDVSIPLDFRYGVFALKYMNYRAKTKSHYEENKKEQTNPQS